MWYRLERLGKGIEGGGDGDEGKQRPGVFVSCGVVFSVLLSVVSHIASLCSLTWGVVSCIMLHAHSPLIACGELHMYCIVLSALYEPDVSYLGHYYYCCCGCCIVYKLYIYSLILACGELQCIVLCSEV